MRITRFGHAALLVESEAARVLIDPGAFSDDAAFALTDLAAVVVTHQHRDHVDRQRLGRLLDRNRQAELLADPATAAELGPPWTPHRDGDVTELGPLTLTGVGEWHATITPDIPLVPNTGVVVTDRSGRRLFHPGDSYASVPEAVDVLALPLSAPWTKVAETIEFARQVAPRAAFAIHDATIAEIAYDIYFGHVAEFSGIDDLRRLGPRASTEM